MIPADPDPRAPTRRPPTAPTAAPPPEAESADPEARFGKFTRTAKLGAGGMGEVWKAWDAELHRWVALKFLKGDDEEEIARFRREAQAAAKLSHPNIAAVYEVGAEHGRQYIAMQFVEGRTLRKLARGDRREAARFLRDAALAVHHAHELGIIHRDLKPDNLMADANGRVYVMDFGLAKVTAPGSSLSQSGYAVGTPAYMPPEQARGDLRAVDARSDVYGLGATLYELVSGRPPFEGEAIDLLLRAATEEAPAVRCGDRDLETIVMKCLEREKERRYATARALAEDLTRWLEGEAIEARPPSVAYRLRKAARRHRVALAIGAALAALAATWAWLVPMWREKRRVEAALELWTRISGVLSDAELRARSGEIESARARLDEGIAACREHLGRGESAAAHYFLGRLLRERGDDEALRHLDRAVELDPRLGEARFERGLLLVERYGERLRLLRELREPSGARRGPIVPAAELERADAELAALRDRAVADLEVDVGRSSFFKPADGLFGRAELARLRGRFDEARARLAEALRADPSYVRAMLSQGHVAVEERNVDEAVRRFSEAIDKHRGFARAWLARSEWGTLLGPRDPATLERAKGDADTVLRLAGPSAAAYTARGRARLLLREFEGAAADFTEAIRLDRPRATHHNNRGIALVRGGRPEEAIREFDEAVKLDPGYAGARANRANARHELASRLAARGRREEASREWGRALEDYAAALEARQDSQTYANRSECRRSAGDFAGALADAEKAVELDAANPEAWAHRGHAKQETGDLDGALADYDRALALEADATVHNGRGSARREKGDVDGAIADYDEALRLNPRYTIAFSNRSNALRDRGERRLLSGRREEGRADLEAAIADADRALALVGTYAPAFSNRGTARAVLGQLEEARRDLDRAVELDPGYAMGWYNRANVREDQKDVEGALADFERAIALDPRPVKALVNRGSLHAKRGELEKALADFDRALLIDPRCGKALKNRAAARGLVGERLAASGRAGEAQKEWRMALVDFEEGFALEPPDASGRRNRALVHARLGDYARAAEDLGEALKLEPGDWETWKNRAILRGMSQDIEGAIADFEKALELAPKDWPERPKVEEAIRRLRE